MALYAWARPGGGLSSPGRAYAAPPAGSSRHTSLSPRNEHRLHWPRHRRTSRSRARRCHYQGRGHTYRTSMKGPRPAVSASRRDGAARPRCSVGRATGVRPLTPTPEIKRTILFCSQGAAPLASGCCTGRPHVGQGAVLALALAMRTLSGALPAADRVRPQDALGIGGAGHRIRSERGRLEHVAGRDGERGVCRGARRGVGGEAPCLLVGAHDVGEIGSHRCRSVPVPGPQALVNQCPGSGLCRCCVDGSVAALGGLMTSMTLQTVPLAGAEVISPLLEKLR